MGAISTLVRAYIYIRAKDREIERQPESTSDLSAMEQREGQQGLEAHDPARSRRRLGWTREITENRNRECSTRCSVPPTAMRVSEAGSIGSAYEHQAEVTLDQRLHPDSPPAGALAMSSWGPPIGWAKAATDSFHYNDD